MLSRKCSLEIPEIQLLAKNCGKVLPRGREAAGSQAGRPGGRAGEAGGGRRRDGARPPRGLAAGEAGGGQEPGPRRLLSIPRILLELGVDFAFGV